MLEAGLENLKRGPTEAVGRHSWKELDKQVRRKPARSGKYLNAEELLKCEKKLRTVGTGSC